MRSYLLNSGDSRCRPWPPSASGRGNWGIFIPLILAFLHLLATPINAQIADELVAAAEAGSATAQYDIGKRYERGDGVEADDFIALRWFRRAAENGHGPAALDLGWMLANGYGAALDMAEAYLWFTIAQGRGVPDAGIQRHAARSELDAPTISALDRKAGEVLGTTAPAVANSEPDVTEDMITEVTVIDDPTTLRRLFWTTWTPDYLARLEKLAAQDDPQAQNLLGLALTRGTDLTRREKGLQWLFKAASSGMVAAQYNLADAYIDRRLGIMDPDAAARWLKEAKRGLAPNTGTSDYETATRLFREAAEYTDPYRAAALGYESATDALAQLIELRRVEAAAMIEMRQRSGQLPEAQ